MKGSRFHPLRCATGPAAIGLFQLPGAFNGPQGIKIESPAPAVGLSRSALPAPDRTALNCITPEIGRD